MKRTKHNQNIFQLSTLPDFKPYFCDNQLTAEGIILFQETIYDYFKNYARDFSWRKTTNPYYIVISEIMLQQTQTHRVKDKFEQFVNAFPTIQSLADTSLKEVLAAWQGLGYNRRAQSLHLLAQRVVNEFHGTIPQTPEILQTFKGIGPATAASICAFAFNSPTTFIETNIRAVFIHAFFREQDQVHDKEIQSLVAQTLDHKNARIWYYALMDYGVMLKKLYPNPNKKSAHYIVQSKFEGSDRQIRGQILRLLLQHTNLSLSDMIQFINKNPDRITKIIQDLANEQLIKYTNNEYSLQD